MSLLWFKHSNFCMRGEKLQIDKRGNIPFLLFFCLLLRFSFSNGRHYCFRTELFLLLFVLLFFFHKICPGHFSETIQPISKFFSGMIGIYLMFVPYWDFWKYHFRFRVRVQVLNNYQRYRFENFTVNRERLELYYLPSFIVLRSPGSDNSGKQVLENV